ncbi:Bardet-Biedl syndrome 4 protein [Diorhabda sublineata]|uniref:Bardet-Biedl syndrome 4 protein n=1 Tax=Diorhabda sublineata TaxID=1163346 RepID=UPI0024E07DE0|nr:Bardet-Biedl syndrome 4 protein [Diorhabda sublineata]
MISNGHFTFSTKIEDKPAKKPFEDEFYSLDKFNWLIHLQHVTGGIQTCKFLISKEIERSKGRNEFALFKQGEIFCEEEKFQEALESFQACLRLNPNNADYLKEVAKCLFAMKRYKLAMEVYLEAERFLNHPDWHVYYYLGQCLLKLGDMHKAQEYAQKAVQVGKHELCYELLIKILMLQNEIKSAVAVSNAAVESCPDSVSMLTESGLLFLKIGQNEFSFERLSSALALEPTHTKALLAIGCIIQKHEDYDVALSKYKMAIHYQPDSIALWNNIGVCFYAKQKYVAAISCLKRALWLDPLNWRVLFNLGLCHLATIQPASAFNYACAAVNLRPDIADSFTILGVTLLELKDPDNAVKAFRLALSLCPDDVYIVVNMALCCVLLGSEKEAIGLMERYGRLMENNTVYTNELIYLADQLIAYLSLHDTNKEICDVSVCEGDIKTQAEYSKLETEE